MADKKQKYKRYYTEWDKMSSDEKYYDKTNNCNKPTYRNDNNKFQLTKTLMKKYKHKAKPAFDENELKELFQKNDYSEEQISKEINYMRNYFAHRKVDKVSNEIIQRFYEDLYFYLKLVIIPCDKALLYEELTKKIKMNVKVAMDVNMRNPFSFDLEKEIKVFGGRYKDGFEKTFGNEDNWSGEDVGKYGCSFEEFEKRYLGFMQVELPKYEFVNGEDIREDIKDEEGNNNEQNVNKNNNDNDNNNNDNKDIHSIHSKEHNDSNSNNNDDNDYSRPIIEQESINESVFNVNVTVNEHHSMNNNNNNNSYSEDNDINI
jgi:hypothetical protein